MNLSAVPALALAGVIALLAPPGLAQAAPNNPMCTVEAGQALIDQGRYQQAIQVFTCVVSAQPTAVEGYRGRIEAQLMLGRYSDAMADYGRVTAFVAPVHPDAEATILDGYAARLASDPSSIHALTGATFARWWAFDYPQAVKLANDLLALRPADTFGNLFRGSSRVLQGMNKAKGVADLERAIELAPSSADVRWVVADAYTYGQPDLARAFGEASLALAWGLDTPRVHAILASAYSAFGEVQAAAEHIDRHIQLVTVELVTTPALGAGQSLVLDFVPGRTYEVPIAATAGQAIKVTTSSRDFWDSIAVLLAPDGTPMVGSDDDNFYFAAFDWIAPATGTYRLRVTSFEALNTGSLTVKRG